MSILDFYGCYFFILLFGGFPLIFKICYSSYVRKLNLRLQKIVFCSLFIIWIVSLIVMVIKLTTISNLENIKNHNIEVIKEQQLKEHIRDSILTEYGCKQK